MVNILSTYIPAEDEADKEMYNSSLLNETGKIGVKYNYKAQAVHVPGVSNCYPFWTLITFIISPKSAPPC